MVSALQPVCFSQYVNYRYVIKWTELGTKKSIMIPNNGNLNTRFFGGGQITSNFLFSFDFFFCIFQSSRVIKYYHYKQSREGELEKNFNSKNSLSYDVSL